MAAVSNFIVDRNQKIYGGRQDDFVARSAIAIREGVEVLTEGMKKVGPSDLFFELLGNFQRERGAIAMAHGTEDADNFGHSRNPKIVQPYHTPMFPGDGKQENPYNKKSVNQFKEIASQLTSPITVENLKSMKTESQENVGALELRETTEVVSLSEIEQKLMSEVHFEDNDQLLTAIRANPDLFKHFILDKLYLQMKWLSPSANLNGFVVSTLTIEIDGKRVPISRLITWIDSTFAEMEKKSYVYLIHQDALFIDETLQEISKVFAQVVGWKEEGDLNEHKESTALFRFLFARCMPSCRGDGAIGDWFEQVLYRYHGLSVQYAPGCLPCFEALCTRTFSDYFENYKKFVTVK